MPCCALILSLIAQPFLAIPAVRRMLEGLSPMLAGSASCCETASGALSARARLLAPLLVLEFFLFSVGTAGAAQMFTQNALKGSSFFAPICSPNVARALAEFRRL